MEVDKPVTIEFNYYDYNDVAVPDLDLTFRNSSIVTITEFFNYCKIFAKAIGYPEDLIEIMFDKET